MLHKLMAAQAKHEEVSKKMIAQCIDEEAFRKKAIADAQNAYNASTNALSKCPKPHYMPHMKTCQH